MSASRVRTETAERMFMWFAVDPADRDGASILMVFVAPDGDENGFAYRPLIAPTLAAANDMAVLAEKAAESLGVTAELREYELVDVEHLAPDHAGPQPETDHCSHDACHQRKTCVYL